MAITVEDGSIVAGANSYVTDEEFTNYADLRGFSYPASAALREPLIILAMDYLENKSYQGARVEPGNQSLPFPRSNVWINGRSVGSNEILQNLKNAQIEAAIAANTQELQINTVSENVQSESMEGLSVSYHSRGSSGKVRLDRVNTWLSGLLVDTSKLVRV